ncbi:hypothetical protein Tco_0875542 [Tanacetum coccineum]|uniref:RNA-directed DNA polymerase, eukaryota, reverse transcriptase zinc-binding domain protein n=1 Tax=Tanacetum coccineum TaxID=301880 RepID=A0ABQ5BPP4_9ASTR
MIDRFRRRISTWKANMLSIGGCFTLIKVVLGSLKAFNLAILQKWRWRLVTFSDSLWARVVKVIHGDDTGMELKGCKVSGNGPLSTRYKRLFHLDADPNCMLADRLSQDTWSWNWKRHLGSRNEESLEILKTEIGRVQVNDCPDSWHWNGGDDGVFSVSATRMHVDNCILPSLSLNLFQWLEDWGSSKDYKDRVYVISAAALWILWRYRNSITFNSHPMRKSDIFDSIPADDSFGRRLRFAVVGLGSAAIAVLALSSCFKTGSIEIEMLLLTVQSSSNLQNVAFVSENTSSTNDVSTAYGVSNTSGHNSKHEQTSSYSLLVKSIKLSSLI